MAGLFSLECCVASRVFLTKNAVYRFRTKHRGSVPATLDTFVVRMVGQTVRVIASPLFDQPSLFSCLCQYRFDSIPKHFEKVDREVDRSARRIFRLNQLRFEEKHFNELLPARAL